MLEDKWIPEPNTGCWLWLLGVDKDGYGKIKVNGKDLRAHRHSYELHVGSVGEKQVLHRCDNPGCVNPQHLFLGSTQDNTADKVAKGRQNKNHTHGMTKFSLSDVLRIRYGKENATLLQKEYAVSNSTIYRIRNSNVWKLQNIGANA